MSKRCSEVGCVRIAASRGKCTMHYLRDRRAGRVVGQTRREKGLLYLKVCIDSDTEKCLTTDMAPSQEYPTIFYDGRYRKVGHLVLERLCGPCPVGMEMRHLCGNARCCNPRHLKWDVHLTNVADKKVHGTEYKRHGEKNPNVKLSKEQVADIRRRVRKGRGPYDRGNAQELADEYQVTTATIRMIARGDTWYD